MTRVQDLPYPFHVRVTVGPEHLAGRVLDAAFEPNASANGGFVRYDEADVVHFGLVRVRAGGIHRARWWATALLYDAPHDAEALVPGQGKAPGRGFTQRAEIELTADVAQTPADS